MMKCKDTANRRWMRWF